MLDEEISNEEILYRAVSFNPNLWSTQENRPSSAVFKDSKGVSVDRNGKREESEIIENLKSRFELKAILSISALECREIETCPISDPLPDNIYHALILESEDKISISSGKARKLVKKASVVIKFD